MKVYIYYDVPDMGIESLTSVAETALRNLLEKEKYRIMWHLRSLENEINESKGMVIIQQDGKIRTVDFTRELTDKIHSLIISAKD